MSTNARISIEEKNGERKSIYLHWDGYIEYAGVTLQLAYNTADKVRELIDLGNLSILGYYINPMTDNHSFDTPDEDVCVAYHRDRGEELEFWGHEQAFNYLFDVEDGCWYLEKDDGRYLLIDEIIELDKEIEKYWRDDRIIEEYHAVVAELKG